MEIKFMCYSCGNPKEVSEKALNLTHAIRKHEKKFNHETLPSKECSQHGQIIMSGSFHV